MEIQSWSRPCDELLVRHQPQNVRQQSQYIRTEWQVYEIAVRNATMKKYLWLVFHINMKRNYQFYVNHMIFPFSILSCLTLFVFWLPPDSGEKITLTITILLALTVFLQLISDYTPKASSNLPIIGKDASIPSLRLRAEPRSRNLLQCQFDLGAYLCGVDGGRSQLPLSRAEEVSRPSLVPSLDHGEDRPLAGLSLHQS